MIFKECEPLVINNLMWLHYYEEELDVVDPHLVIRRFKKYFTSKVYKHDYNLFLHGVHVVCASFIFRQMLCHNPSPGLTTKTWACKGASQKGNLRVIFNAHGNVGECEGMNPHIPK